MPQSAKCELLSYYFFRGNKIIPIINKAKDMSSDSKRIKIEIEIESESDNESLFEEPIVLSQSGPSKFTSFMNGDYGKVIEKKTLDLSKSKIHVDETVMKEICEKIISLGNRVEVLNLSSNPITSKNAIVLFDLLKEKNSKIKVINLGSTHIRDSAMKSLGEYISNNAFITDVSIGKMITDKGLAMFFGYLANNKTLKYLRLAQNKKITDASSSILAKMLDFSKLEILDINETSVTQKRPLELPMVLKKN